MPDFARRVAVFRVLVEFAEWVTNDDIVTDLEQSSLHRFHDYEPSVARSLHGRTELTLTVDGPDLWTSALTVMALVRQSGFEPSALHVAAPLESTQVA
jgi:hypothetical protein